MIFFFRQKMKDVLFQKTHGNMTFSVYMHKSYKYDIILLPKGDIFGINEKDDIYPRKYGAYVEMKY